MVTIQMNSFKKDDFDAERQTNLSAVVASLRTANPASNKDLVLKNK